MAHPHVVLSRYEKAQQLLSIPQIFVKTIISTIATVIHDGSFRHLKRTIVVSLLHHQSSATTFRQRLAKVQPTSLSVSYFCKTRGLSCISVPVSIPAGPSPASTMDSSIPPAKLHHISIPLKDSSLSPASPTRTIFYIHGGGYAISPIEGQFTLAVSCAIAARAPTLIVLEYSLTPELQYPGQLIQALAALRGVIEERDIPPQDIILLGDSAGANAILGMLASLKSGSGPRGWWPFARSGAFGGVEEERLGAVVLISPWCGIRTDRESYRVNGPWDFITKRRMEDFVGAWAPEPGEVWGDVVGAAEKHPKKWGGDFWRSVASGSSRVVNKTFVAVGTRECVLDEAAYMARLMGADDDEQEKTSVTFVRCTNEVHVCAALDAALGIEDGEMYTAVMAFMKSL